MGSSTSKSNKSNSPRDPGGGDSGEWKDFPTYQNLRRAQREYAQNPKEQSAIKDPLRPFPPLTTKEELCQHEDFEEIDEHARNAPLHLAAESYKALVGYLVQPARNDVQRIRAFYTWIASQNPDIVTFYTNGKTPDERSPLYPLLITLLKKWRKGYAYLFYHMCKTIGIPCQRVRGLVKGASYQPGKPVKGKNTYCLVYVDGSWRFVDQHWGSASASKDPNTIKKDEDGEEQEEEFLMHYKVDDFWFLTDPEVMIHTHFPDDPNHQLLARKVTLEEFHQMPDINEHYFRLGFHSINPPVNEIRTDTGNVDINVGLDRKRYYDFTFELLKYGEKGPTIKMYRNIYLNQMVFMVCSERYLKLHIELPEIGKYRLEIGGKDLKDEKADFKRFSSYVIYCRVPNFDYKVYPYQEETRWGLFGEGRFLGLQSSVKEGVILAPEGIAEFSLTTPSCRDVVFSHTIENASYGREYLSSYTTQYRYGRDTMFLSKLPAHGSYICKVYARERGEETELQQVVCRYLIMCYKGCADMTPYPATHVGQGPGSVIRWTSTSTLASPLNGRTSNSSHYSKNTAPSTDSGYSGAPSPLVIPVTHKHPVINNVDQGKVEIILETRHCEQLEFLTNLQLHMKDGKLQEQSEYVLSHRTPSQLIYNLRFLQAGFHTFNIYYQQCDKKSGTQFGFAYLIHVQKPLSDCLPFPALGVDWQDEYLLISPQDGLLEPNTKVAFKVKIPRAKQVYLLHSGDNVDKKESLQAKDKDIWSQDVDTGVADSDIDLHFIGEDDHEGHLATFKVVSVNQLASVKEAQRRAAQEAHRQEEEVLKRRRALEVAAEARRQREEEAIRSREEEFERERLEKEKAEEERERRERANAARTPATTQPEDGPLDTAIDDAYLQRLAEDRRKKWDINERNLEGWRRYHDEMVHKMAADRMREALRKRERGLLEKALQECEVNNMSEQMEGDIRRAEIALQVLNHKERLKDACKAKDTVAIRNEIDSIESAGVSVRKHLQNEVREARYMAERQERLDRLHHSILDMDKKTMTEIRRYHKPPTGVHQVMQASLLIMGEDEESTAEWRDCQKLLNPQGAGGLNRRVMDLNVEKVHPEIAARAKIILEDKDMSLDKVNAVSHGAGTFWVWTMGLIEEVERYQKSQGGKSASPVKPASVMRQKELFGRLAPTQRSPYRNRRNGQVAMNNDSGWYSERNGAGPNTLTPRDVSPNKRYVSPARTSNPTSSWH